jgi:hypothetical protein
LKTGVRQLFLDDFVIGGLYRVTRHVHHVTKYQGNPVLRADQPWEKMILPGSSATTELVEFYNSPCWDAQGQVWKMWYVIGDGRLAGFARSSDGIHWEKPILNKKEYQGSRANNLVLVKDDPGAEIVHALLDPEAPPARRYKGLSWVGAQGRRVIASSDGYEFHNLDVPPISGQDTSHLTWDETQGRYILTVKHPGPFGRSVYLSLSQDMQRWTPHELIFHADAADQELARLRIEEHLSNPRLYAPSINRPEEYRAEVYMMPVFPYEGLYIGLPVFFESSGRTPPPHNNQDGINSVKLACSRDLRAWTKVGKRESFMPVSLKEEGALDIAQVLPATRPVIREDELWFYYNGIDTRYPKDGAYRGAIHLAKLRRDGFASLHGEAAGGFVETRAIRFDGGHMFVNADASRGEIVAEVLDARGREVLKGWSRGQAHALKGNQLRGELSWQGHPGVRELRGQTVRVRFHLRNADLYSFWIEP